MIKFLVSIFKNKQLRKQLIFTLAILFVFRLGASITVPGISLRSQFDTNSFFGVLNMLGGGALRNFSIFALGVSPYITASIVVNLLALDVIPSWKEHLKSGEIGKKQLALITRRLALFISFFQGFALTRGMSQQGIIALEQGVAFWFVLIILVAGAMITIWLGDQISQHGISNGVSIIIFAGIVASIPYELFQTFQVFVIGDSAQELFAGLLNFSFYLAAWYGIISFMVYIDQAERKIPIQYSNAYDIKKQEEVSFLPIKVNIAGVIPIIFASSMILAPQSISLFFPESTLNIFISRYFNFQNPWTYSAYLLMIFGFTYFQAFASVNPEEIADSLNKSSSFIPGIRSGQETQKYIKRIIQRICAFGGLYLVLIAALPKITEQVLKINAPLQLGGTSFIIVSAVALEVYRQIKGQMFMASYTGFSGSNQNKSLINKKRERSVW